MVDYGHFIEWILEKYDNAADVDRGLMANWLRPNFQNYCSDDVFAVNPNGVALRELSEFLAKRGQTTNLRRPARGSTRKILLVSRYAPSTSHAGGLRIFDLYSELRKLSPNLHLELYAPSEPAIDGNTETLRDVFDKITFTTMARFSYGDFVLRNGEETRFDVLDAQFHDAGRLIPRFRNMASFCLFTPMECMARTTYDRMAMNFEETSQLKLSDVFATIHETLKELRIVARADETVCVSDADADFLRRLSGPHAVNFIPTGVSEVEFRDQLKASYTPPPLSDRPPRLVFAAYYGSETNVVGLKWYLDHVHPKVLEAVPSYKLSVVGRGDLDWLMAENRPGVTVVGEVPNLAPVLEQSRAGLVLALHGAGFRGKINQYAICGLPTISTPLGLTGLCYTPGEDILSAQDAGEFAVECVRILTDDAYCDRIGWSARQTALKNYAWPRFHDRIREIYAL